MVNVLGPTTLLLVMSGAGMLTAAAAGHGRARHSAGPVREREVTDWPQMGRTPSFRSCNNVSIPSEPPHPEWTFKNATSRLVSSPAVWHGVVYIGSDDGHLYALEQATGKLKWKFAQSCMPADSIRCGENGIRSSPAVDTTDGSIAFGSYDGHAYKVSPEGKLLWSYKTGGKIYSPATIGPDSTVFLGTMRPDNCVYALSGQTTARLQWKACGEQGIRAGEMNSGPAIGDPGGPLADAVVMNNFDKHIRAFNRSSGALLWSHEVQGPSGGSATIVDSTVYVGSWDRNYYALDGANGGSELWAYASGGEIESHGAYAEGVVYITAEESHSLVALDSKTGKQLWKYDGPSQEMNGSPSVSQDLIYAGANDGAMHVVHRKTGALAYKVTMPEGCENVFSSAAIADNGMAYFSCNSPTADRRQLMQSELEVVPKQQLGVLFAINPALHM